MAMELILLAVLIILSALFSGVETAVISVNKIKIKHLLEKNVKNAKVLDKIKNDSHKTISTLLIGNNIVNIAASALSTSLAIKRFGSIGPAIATGIMTFVILVFAEITPKTIANSKPEKVALFFAKVVNFLNIVLTPIRKFLDIFTLFITKLFGIKNTERTITEEEIKSIVNISEKEGEIKSIEKDMIHKIFQFNDIEVEKIMTPKNDITMFEENTKVKDALTKMIKTGYSRFPIYEKDNDKVTGIAYLKDIVKIMQKKRNPKLKEIAKKPFFVPESKKIDKLLKEFQKKKIHIAPILDEYGTFVGLVTIEDLIEEIVGEIYDEQDAVVQNIKKIDKKHAIVLGDTPIGEINKSLKTNIRYGAYETISAYLLDKMGKIPKSGETYELKRFTFKIKEMDDNRIIKVDIQKK